MIPEELVPWKDLRLSWISGGIKWSIFHKLKMRIPLGNINRLDLIFSLQALAEDIGTCLCWQIVLSSRLGSSLTFHGFLICWPNFFLTLSSHLFTHRLPDPQIRVQSDCQGALLRQTKSGLVMEFPHSRHLVKYIIWTFTVPPCNLVLSNSWLF